MSFLPIFPAPTNTTLCSFYLLWFLFLLLETFCLQMSDSWPSDLRTRYKNTHCKVRSRCRDTYSAGGLFVTFNHLGYFIIFFLGLVDFSGEGHGVSCLKGIPLAANVLVLLWRKGAGEMTFQYQPPSAMLASESSLPHLVLCREQTFRHFQSQGGQSRSSRAGGQD